MFSSPENSFQRSAFSPEHIDNILEIVIPRSELQRKATLE
jgi:hypothetical protein